MDTLQHRRQQLLGKIVRRVPEQDHIEPTPREIQVRCEKPLYIEAYPLATLLGNDPIALGRVLHQVRQVDAVPQRRDEVDVGRRRRTDIQNTQRLLAAHPLQQLTPSAGMP